MTSLAGIDPSMTEERRLVGMSGEGHARRDPAGGEGGLCTQCTYAGSGRGSKRYF